MYSPRVMAIIIIGILLLVHHIHSFHLLEEVVVGTRSKAQKNLARPDAGPIG
jgi:hypothetical protein